jgi:UDP-N-acetyl-D-glucosamine dehydrogenase
MAKMVSKLVVVGQGYVGLPVAMRAAEIGFRVVGFDLDKTRVDQLARGESFIEDVTGSDLAAALDSGLYLPTADPAALAGFDIAVVSVPTPLLDGSPDLSAVRQAATDLARHVRPRCCVILESTTYPGTTEEVLVPLLESDGPLRAGRDFFVGYSPERIDPGNQVWKFHNTPKVVSGVNEESRRVVADFYSRLVDQVVPVAGPREAEMTKLIENTFRHLNIAFVNELAICCHTLGIDVWEVIDAAATKPFGFMRFNPGPGIGGHCLPIDPSYLSWQVRRSLRRSFRLIDVANDINHQMPQYVVDRTIAYLNQQGKAVNGSRLLLVGLTYKANSKDARESPATGIAHLLANLGAQVQAIDPLIDPHHVPTGVELVDGTAEQCAAADLIIVLTDHDEVEWPVLELDPYKIFDTRRRLHHPAVHRL